MKFLRSLSLLACALGTLSGCRFGSDGAESRVKAAAAERSALLAKRLAVADSNPSGKKPVALWVMPAELREISGLALTADGLLLAHGDEQALIYIINPRTGIVVDRFHVGKKRRGDFEGITVAGSDIFLLESNGSLLQFKRGGNGDRVKFAVRDARLGKECEFEGVAYQADSAWLVMPCKRVSKKSMRDQMVFYRFRIQGPDNGKVSMFTVPLHEVIGSNDWKEFNASDMTIDPGTGNYVIVSSQQKGLVVMTPTGEVLRSEPLPGKHLQAEGVAVTSDNILIISDEARNDPAVISLYRWRN